MLDQTPLHDRLHAVVGSMSHRRLGELTGTNPETVRRYMNGQSPSIEFLTALCARMDVSAEWLLTGRGARAASKTREHALREANPSELLGAMAATVERLAERVQRLEFFVQSLDARLRVAVETPTKDEHEPPPPILPISPTREPAHPADPAHPGDLQGGARVESPAWFGTPAERARSVAGALAERSRSTDG